MQLNHNMSKISNMSMLNQWLQKDAPSIQARLKNWLVNIDNRKQTQGSP